MARDSRRYNRLLKAQELVKARDEADLETMRTNLANLEDEDQYLFNMMENETNALIIDPTLITKRLERNAREEGVLQARITTQRQLLLQSSRRADILAEKRKQAQAFEERKETASMLEEYVATKIFKNKDDPQ